MIKNFINDTVLHEECKNYEQFLYDWNPSSLPKTAKMIDVGYIPQHPDFNYGVFQNGNNVFMVMRGTDLKFEETTIENYPIDSNEKQYKNLNRKNDLLNDKDIFLGHIPAQTSDAFGLYETLKSKYPKEKGYNIISVGYSLSGCMSEILHAVTGVPTVTFNALGAKNLLPKELQHNSGDIVNYCNQNDALTMSNSRNHIGICYTIDTRDDYTNWNQHKLQAFKPLNTRELFDNTNHYSVYNAVADVLPNMEDFPDIGYIKERTKDIIKNPQSINEITTPVFKGRVVENVYYDGKKRTPIKGQATGYAANITAEEKQDIINKYKNTEAFKYYSDEEIWNRYVDFEENKFFNPENRVFYQNEYNPMLAPKGSNDNLGRIFGRATALA